MKISFSVNTQKNIRNHWVQGVFSVEELKEELIALYRSSDYDQNLNSLWDLTQADLSNVTLEEVHSLTKLVNKYWGIGGKNRSALVVQSKLGYGLSRMFELMLDGISASNVMVFENDRDAVKWLEFSEGSNE